MAVYSSMRGEIVSIKQRIRNAGDGISLLQNTDSKLSGVGDVLVRMKELAEQAANSTYSPDQRRVIDAEFTQLLEEIDFIKGINDLNGINLLADNSGSVTINTDGKSGFSLDGFNILGGGLNGVDILNDPNAALELIGKEISANSESRANAGTKANILESETRNMQEKLFNVQDAASRIGDVDIAKEIAENMEHMVLSQAAAAMAAQSNNIHKDMVMSLLGTA
jgi:flagellin